MFSQPSSHSANGSRVKVGLLSKNTYLVNINGGGIIHCNRQIVIGPPTPMLPADFPAAKSKAPAPRRMLVPRFCRVLPCTLTFVPQHLERQKHGPAVGPPVCALVSCASCCGCPSGRAKARCARRRGCHGFFQGAYAVCWWGVAGTRVVMLSSQG